MNPFFTVRLTTGLVQEGDDLRLVFLGHLHLSVSSCGTGSYSEDTLVPTKGVKPGLAKGAGG